MTLAGLGVANLKSWKLTKEAQAQLLEIVLNEPVRDVFDFNITCERPAAGLPADRGAPSIGAAAQRVENEMALESEDGVELTPQPAPGFRQIVWNHERIARMHLAGAYAYGGTGTAAAPGPAYRLRLAPLKYEACVNYVYQVDRRKIELIALMHLDAKGHDLFSATVAVPPGFDIQAVQSERLADWWLDGDALRVRFSGAPPGQTPLMVYLVRRYTSAPEKLELTPLTLREFDTVRGEAVIAAHKGVSAAMELAEAKEIAPEAAATDFSILPPLERKRGFSFTTQSFKGTVTLGAQAPRMSSTWVMDARVHESWVSLSTRVQTALRQGSIASLSFNLPAVLPEAHVTGLDIRETTSKIAGDRRVYDVVFQNEIYNEAAFTIDLEIPSSTGSTALPALEIAGQDRTSGFVLVENVSEYEMQLSPTGLDTAQRNELPFLPELIQSASLFRAQPGWTLGITTTRLEKAASRAAFVAWVEITTAFRADGTEWNRAVYHLQNRSLQFLPVKLPPEMELVTVRVAGQVTRADAGQVEGQDVILVPLIKTKQGDLSFEVELVYRAPAQRRHELGPMARRSLHDPALVGITVEKTLWNLYVPHDRTLVRASGNMQPVLDEVNKTEKLAGSLQELKDLASVVSSESASASARQNAISNFGRLSKILEQEVKAAGDFATISRSRKMQPAVSGKDAESQTRFVSQCAGELQNELERQNAQVRQITASGGTLGLKGGNAYTGATQITAGNRGAQDFAGGVVSSAPASAVKLQPPFASWATNDSYADRSGAAASKMKSIPQQQAAASANTQDFGINDFVVLQNKVATRENTALKQPTALESGIAGASAAAAANSQLTNSGAGEIVGFTRGWSKKRPEQSTKPRERGLNTARGNIAVQEDATIARDGSQTVDFGLQRGKQTISLDSAAEQQLRPSGRISLPVDFPTQGEALHFKKLKSNAALEVWIRQPSAFERQHWFTRFLMFAVPLAVLGVLLDRRGSLAAKNFQ